MQDLIICNWLKRTAPTSYVLGSFMADIVVLMWSLMKIGSCATTNLHFNNFCVETILKIKISKETVFIAIKYVQKYMKRGNTANFKNEYELFTIALMVAHKWHNEPVYKNKTWSDFTHIPLIEINKLEIAFIESLNYKIHIDGEKYSFWLNCLTEYVKTGKLVSLFFERFNKNSTPSPPPPPGFGFALKSRIIPTPIGYERNQYKLYDLFDGFKLDFFQQTQNRSYDLYDGLRIDFFK
ncbi:11778_t:CDS:2 [Diversispora eburnea]|uniref:11778_t:CDS:1 n=1 Tax=Diversispora eburnea TaxID=1213867 RepID=A0A9N9FL56_9GLOM|nr:11778_t:CDS:2 [Diversispora eburnea]